MSDLSKTQRPSRFPALCSIPTQPIPLSDRDLDVVPARVVGRTPMGALEAFVMSKINGLRSIADLAALADLSPREVLHLVAGMVNEGTVTMTSRRSFVSAKRRPVDPRSERSVPPHAFVDFADIFEELGIEQSASASSSRSQPRATLPVANR